MNQEEKAKVTQKYYEKEGKLIKRIIDGIVFRLFPATPNSQMDDFYSVGNEVFVKCLDTYDDSNAATFSTYLYRCLENNIKTQVTHINRAKRGGKIKIESFSQIIGDEDDGRTLGDTIESPNRFEDDLIRKYCDREEWVDNFLNHLSRETRDVANMITSGWGREELRQNWGVTNKQYEHCIEEMRRPSNSIILRKRIVPKDDKINN